MPTNTQLLTLLKIAVFLTLSLTAKTNRLIKCKEVAGITNKCIFKHMDILDEIGA